MQQYRQTKYWTKPNYTTIQAAKRMQQYPQIIAKSENFFKMFNSQTIYAYTSALSLVKTVPGKNFTIIENLLPYNYANF